MTFIVCFAHTHTHALNVGWTCVNTPKLMAPNRKKRQYYLSFLWFLFVCFLFTFFLLQHKNVGHNFRTPIKKIIWNQISKFISKFQKNKKIKFEKKECWTSMRFSFGIRFGKVSVKIIADQFFLNMHTHQPATQSRALKKNTHIYLKRDYFSQCFQLLLICFSFNFFLPNNNSLRATTTKTIRQHLQLTHILTILAMI